MVEVRTNTGWAWIVLVGAFCAHAITFGIVYSFGIMFIALEERFASSKTKIAWIPSLTTGLLHSSGLLASILVNKFGCRLVTVVGGITCSVGYVLSIFAPNVYYLYFTLGVIVGCGFGMVFMPAVLIVTQYFVKLRSVACGVALSGCGIGVFIFSPLLKLLLDDYSLEGTLLIVSAITLNYIPCGLVFLPLLDKRGKDPDTNFKTCDDPDVFDSLMEHESSKTVITDIICLNKDRSEFRNCSSKQLKTTDRHDNEITLRANCIESHENGVNDKGDDGDSVIIIEHSNKRHKPPSQGTSGSLLMQYLLLLKRKDFLLFFISQFLFIFGFYLPFIFIPDKAKGLGISEESSAWVASVIGISSISGRVILGYIADRPSVSRFLMFKVALLMTGLSTSLCPVLNSLWSMMVYAVVYGVTAGFTISVTSVVLLDLMGLECLTEALGLISLSSGIGSVLGPPFAGLLYDITGSYTAPFLASGSSMSLAAISVFLISYVNKTKS